ncbi:MAG: hypothetical protein LBF90_05200 [Prevotellaceae bacterium]|jgi:hypothetical protein|nr:hypothetical protein [Prevotellaceae bacterium]
MKHIVIISIFTFLFSFALIAQENDIIWDYPVKPGSEQWATFATGKQLLEACQIPQVVLDNINTTDLVGLCLDYPLLFEYTAFSDEREGIRIMMENFNGLKELSKRKDGAQKLANVYKGFPVVPSIMIKKDDIPYKLILLELLLANDSFINQLSTDELVELNKIVLNKYEYKLKHTDVYSIYNIKRTFLLGAVVLDKQNKSTKTQQSVIKNFIKNYNNADSSLLTEISKILSQL